MSEKVFFLNNINKNNAKQLLPPSCRLMEPKTSSLFYWLLHRVKTLAVVQLILCSLTGAFVRSFDSSFPLADRMEPALFSISAIPVIINQIVSALSQKKVKVFFNEIENLYHEASKEAKYKEILDGYVKLGEKLHKSFLAILSAFVPVMFATAFVGNMSREKPKTPFPFWIPFDYEKHYALACVYQAFGSFLPAAAMATQHSVIIQVSFQITGQYKILQDILKNRKPGSNHTQCYIIHRKILKLVKTMNEIYSGMFFIEIMLSSAQCCIAGYGAMKDDSNRLEFTCLFVDTLVLPAVICICCSLITKEAQNLHDASYQNKWYEETPCSRRDLLILSTMTAKDVKIHYKYLIDFDLQRLSLIFQGAYSYTTVLKTID